MSARGAAFCAAWCVLGGLPFACAARPSGPAEPTPAPLSALPLVASASAAPLPALDVLSLETFTPLLALPELALATARLEAGDAAGAAREVEGAMQRTPPATEDVPRWQFLLARLRESAGDLRGALASYDLAGEPSWPLASDARVAAARLVLRAGRGQDALDRLERVTVSGPLAQDRVALEAEAAALAGETSRAIDAWQAQLAGAGVDAAGADAVRLRLASALLDRAAKTPAPPTRDQDREQALALARRVRLTSVGASAEELRAQALESRALAALPGDRRALLGAPNGADLLLRARALVDAGKQREAQETIDRLLHELPTADRFGDVGCEAALLLAKAQAGEKANGVAADTLSEPIARCKSEDIHARALYLGAKFAAADGRHAVAVSRYLELERAHPRHRLADDARVGAAASYWELGEEARFTELLAALPEDYPGGDVVLDGLFRLAMRRVEKGDWPGAASVLTKGNGVAKSRDAARGSEYAGRERYFLARAQLQLGDTEQGIAELASITRELPLSYYMLHAYSRLLALRPELAASALAAAREKAAQESFSIERRPELESPAFVRAMELLRVGEIASGKREIAALGLEARGTEPAILWGIALLYARAGSPRLSHAVASGLLTDWIQRWPAGDWTRAWQLAFPRPYLDLVQREARAAEVPEFLVYGVMREESAFDPEAHSAADAYGLMQLVEPTARMYAKKAGLPWDAAALKRPAVNIALGCRVLAKLNTLFADVPELSIPGYNAGPNRPRRWRRERAGLDFDLWVELIPLTETRRYTKRVLASRAAYAVLYDPEHADQALRLPLNLATAP